MWRFFAQKVHRSTSRSRPRPPPSRPGFPPSRRRRPAGPGGASSPPPPPPPHPPPRGPPAPPPRPRGGARGGGGALQGCHDLVHEAVGLRLGCGEEEVPVRVLPDPLQGLVGVLREDGVEGRLHLEDLLGVDGHVGGGPAHAAPGLVDHHPGVGEGEPLPLGAGGEEDRPHGGGLPDAVGRDVGLYELHRVVDGQPRGDGAAGGVDVEVDVPGLVLLLEEQELGDDGVRQGIGDHVPDEDDVVLEEPGVDVVGALAAPRLLDHVGDVEAAGFHGPSRRLPRPSPHRPGREGNPYTILHRAESAVSGSEGRMKGTAGAPGRATSRPRGPRGRRPMRRERPR